MIEVDALHCQKKTISLIAKSKNDYVITVAIYRLISILSEVIAAGSGVSYGHQYIAAKDTRIAVVGIGYADGIPRNLSLVTGF